MIKRSGEAAADCGGPLRDLLKMAMQIFCDIPSII